MDDFFLEKNLAAVAAAIADTTRARILSLLMDGRAYTATELSAAADIAPSTASSHLARLCEQRLIDCLPQGRYRYFRLSGPRVAHALETLMGLAAEGTESIPSRTPPELRFARTCYDHMAGTVAVALHDRLIASGWLEATAYTLTTEGQAALGNIGIALSPASTRRRFACPCLDWSARKPHLGGQLGAAFLQAFLQKNWVERMPDSRALSLTDNGHQGMTRHFKVSFS